MKLLAFFENRGVTISTNLFFDLCSTHCAYFRSNRFSSSLRSSIFLLLLNFRLMRLSFKELPKSRISSDLLATQSTRFQIASAFFLGTTCFTTVGYCVSKLGVVAASRRHPFRAREGPSSRSGRSSKELEEKIKLEAPARARDEFNYDFVIQTNLYNLSLYQVDRFIYLFLASILMSWAKFGCFHDDSRSRWCWLSGRVRIDRLWSVVGLGGL